MFEVELYTTAAGVVPVDDWLRSLADEPTTTRIAGRVLRLRAGNFGDCKSVGGGVYELRMDFGPGYRLYYARVGRTVLLLICGGDKSTQKADIKRAVNYLTDWREREE